MRHLALIGHGSRKPEGNAEVFALAERLAPHGPVHVGFIELAAPRAADALDAAVAAGATEVVALPAVLLAAAHSKNDVPLAVAQARLRHPQVTFATARPLGVHAGMVSALSDRYAAVAPDEDPARTAVILLGRGSSDPDANADLCKLARLHSERRGLLSADVAYVGVTTPSLQDALATALLRRPRAVVVLPYLLYPGVLLDRVRAEVAAFAALYPRLQVACAEPVGTHPAVVEVLLERAHEALSGAGGMACDACKYRAPLPGFGGEVGGAAAMRKATAHALLPLDAPPHAHVPPRKHVLVCVNRDCADRGSVDVLNAVRDRLRDAGRTREIRTTRVMCLGRCGEGPALCVYPDGVWYRQVRPQDVPELVDDHLLGDRPIGRLIDLLIG